MARKKEIWQGKLEDGIMHIHLAHWKHFPKLISRDLLKYPGYIFRGQASSNWKLESSYDRLVRKKKVKSSNINGHLNAFKNASKGRRGKNPEILPNDNEWWALAQHNGMATPLLDFTRSVFVALYFAFWDETFSGKERAVYCLHYYNLQKKMVQIDDKNEKIEMFYPSTDDHERLINQSGLFVKMPVNTNLEDLITSKYKEYDKGAVLIKIHIPNIEAEKCLIMLNRMNINHSTLFPDLYGAAKYVNCMIDKPNYDNIQSFNLDS